MLVNNLKMIGIHMSLSCVLLILYIFQGEFFAGPLLFFISFAYLICGYFFLKPVQRYAYLSVISMLLFFLIFFIDNAMDSEIDEIYNATDIIANEWGSYLGTMYGAVLRITFFDQTEMTLLFNALGVIIPASLLYLGMMIKKYRIRDDIEATDSNKQNAI